MELKLNYDEHFNIFWNYGGDPRLENNVTKAIINFMQYSDIKTQFRMIDYFTDKKFSFDRSRASVKYGLQRRPDEPVKFMHKLLVGISPTGREWPQEIVFLYNRDKFRDLKKVLESNDDAAKERYCKENNLDISPDNYELVLAEIGNIENKGEAIPDAWIMVYIDQAPHICIALENKLWDLDPFQLRNHMVKSMGIVDEFDKHKSIKKYEDFYAMVESSRSSIVRDNLLEFFYLLGYQPFRPFDQQEYDAAKNNPSEMRSNVLLNKWSHFFEKLTKDHKESINLAKRQLWFPNIESGNIYFNIHDLKINDLKGYAAFVGSEIGVKYKYINETLHRNLTKSDIKALSSYFGEFANEFVIYARFKAVTQFEYCDLEYFNNLGDALIYFKNRPSIFIPGETKKNCLKFLADHDYDTEETKINKYSHRHWDILFYIRIISNIKISEVCTSYENLGDLFSKRFQQHRIGLSMFEDIYKR